MALIGSASMVVAVPPPLPAVAPSAGRSHRGVDHLYHVATPDHNDHFPGIDQHDHFPGIDHHDHLLRPCDHHEHGQATDAVGTDHDVGSPRPQLRHDDNGSEAPARLQPAEPLRVLSPHVVALSGPGTEYQFSGSQTSVGSVGGVPSFMTSPGGPYLYDSNGRVVLMHGTNVVYKHAPYIAYPDPGGTVELQRH